MENQVQKVRCDAMRSVDMAIKVGGEFLLSGMRKRFHDDGCFRWLRVGASCMGVYTSRSLAKLMMLIMSGKDRFLWSLSGYGDSVLWCKLVGLCDCALSTRYCGVERYRYRCKLQGKERYSLAG
jgi:hypothetical protein